MAALVFTAACGPSLVAASGGYSLAVVHTLLIVMASLVAEHRLQGAWSQWPPQHVESCQTRDRTNVPCIGRWISNHWTIREILFLFLRKKNLL